MRFADIFCQGLLFWTTLWLRAIHHMTFGDNSIKRWGARLTKCPSARCQSAKRSPVGL